MRRGVENTEESVEPTEEQTEENKQEEENVETQEENIEDETEFVEENVLVDNQKDIPEDEEQVSDPIEEVGAIITDINGNKTNYPTFKEATKNAKAGDTITLMEEAVLGEWGATTKGFNITIDMNGHNIDGTGATKNNGRVLLMTTKSSSEKPIEGKEPFFRITNSQSDGGKITGKLPFETSCGNGKDTVPVIIDENVKLITTEEGTNAVKLGSLVYLIYNESTKDYIKNGGFRVTADDNSERIYGNFANEVSAATKGGTIYMLHDYIGNESIYSGSKGGTLDLDGHTYTYAGKDQIVNVNYDDTELTIKNGYLTTTADKLNQGGITVLYNNSSITLDKVQMDVPGDSYGIVTNGTNVNNGVSVKAWTNISTSLIKQMQKSKKQTV